MLFVDQQFPIEIGSVQSDHDFLDQDSIQSLFRLVTHASTVVGVVIGHIAGSWCV